MQTTTKQQVKIGKTVYNVESAKSREDAAGTIWEIRAGNSKQVKTLSYSESLDQYTLWSTRNGLRGLGMPKLVAVEFIR